MKKSTKYSAMIVAALFAVTPIVLNNSTSVKADEMANGASGEQDNNPKTDKEIQLQSTDSIKDAEKVTYKYDSDMATKIKWNKDLTASDVGNYFKKHAHVYGDENKELKASYECYGDDLHPTPKNKDPKLNAGNKINFSVLIDDGLEKNTWYEWNQDTKLSTGYQDISLSDIPKSILNRLAQKRNESTNDYTVAVKTDSEGHVPEVRVKKETQHQNARVTYFSIHLAPFHEFTISNDADAVEIPHIVQPSQPQPTTPVQPTKPSEQPTQATQDLDKPEQPTQPIQNSQISHDTDELIPTKPVQPTQPTQLSGNAENAQPTKPVNSKTRNNHVGLKSSDKKTLMFSRNAFVYNKKGKLVKRNGMFILKRRNHNFKAWNNGKVVIIKGKKFYQIGKNSFVKVRNTTALPKAQALKASGKVKGTKKVRLYNADGKLIKKLHLGKTLKFDKKNMINGHLCYRIKGTNYWIRSTKVKINK